MEYFKTIFASAHSVAKDDEGVTAVEYGLIAALIAVAISTIVGTVGTNLTTTFTTIASKL
jgi:pilus assembly protein Flp/PilA